MTGWVVEALRNTEAAFEQSAVGTRSGRSAVKGLIQMAAHVHHVKHVLRVLVTSDCRLSLHTASTRAETR